MYSTFTSEEVLDIFWDKSYPVNPADIAHALCMYVEYAGNMTESVNIQVLCGVPVICFNSNDVILCQRFAVAHAIGHFVLGHCEPNIIYKDHVDEFSLDNEDPVESQANTFAIELLLPKIAIENEIINNKVRTVTEIANIFDVTPAAVRFRFYQLGLFKKKSSQTLS